MTMFLNIELSLVRKRESPVYATGTVGEGIILSICIRVTAFFRIVLHIKTIAVLLQGLVRTVLLDSRI